MDDHGAAADLGTRLQRVEEALRARGVPDVASQEFFKQRIEPLDLRELAVGFDFDGVKAVDGGEAGADSLARTERIIANVVDGQLGGAALFTGRMLRQLPPSLHGRLDIYAVSGHERLLAGEPHPVVSDTYQEARSRYEAFRREFLTNPELRRLQVSARPGIADSLPSPGDIRRLTTEQLDQHFWADVRLLRFSGMDISVVLSHARPEDHPAITESVEALAARHGLSGPSKHGDHTLIVADPSLNPNKGAALNHWGDQRRHQTVIVIDDADRGLGAYPARNYLGGQGELWKIAAVGPTVLDRPYMIEAPDLAGYVMGLAGVAQFEDKLSTLAEARASRPRRA